MMCFLDFENLSPSTMKRGDRPIFTHGRPEQFKYSFAGRSSKLESSTVEQQDGCHHTWRDSRLCGSSRSNIPAAFFHRKLSVYVL